MAVPITTNRDLRITQKGFMQVRVESCSLHTVFHGRCMPHCSHELPQCVVTCGQYDFLVHSVHVILRKQLLDVISCPYIINYKDKLFLYEECVGANTVLIALTIVNFIMVLKHL